MSTIYVFDQELSALTTGAADDKVLIHDTSAGTKKYIAVSDLQTVLLGLATTSVVAFHGVTKTSQIAHATLTTGSTVATVETAVQAILAGLKLKGLLATA